MVEDFTVDAVAEEIEMSLGLKTVIRGRAYYAQTIAGEVKILTCGSLMASYYRFLIAYGYKLKTYGLKNKLEEESKLQMRKNEC